MPESNNTGSAGDYWMKVTWMKHSVTEDTDSGQDVDNYSDNGKLWCWIVDEKTREEQQYGARNHVTQGEIHLRGFPTVNPNDRFYDLFNQRMLQCRGIRYDYNLNETVVDHYMISSLQG